MQERFRKTDRALEEVPTWPNVGHPFTFIQDYNRFVLRLFYGSQSHSLYRLMRQGRSNKGCSFVFDKFSGEGLTFL